MGRSRGFFPVRGNTRIGQVWGISPVKGKARDGQRTEMEDTPSMAGPPLRVTKVAGPFILADLPLFVVSPTISRPGLNKLPLVPHMISHQCGTVRIRTTKWSRTSNYFLDG